MRWLLIGFVIVLVVLTMLSRASAGADDGKPKFFLNKDGTVTQRLADVERDTAELKGDTAELKAEVAAIKRQLKGTAAAPVPASPSGVVRYQRSCDPVTGRCTLVPVPVSSATAAGCECVPGCPCGPDCPCPPTAAVPPSVYAPVPMRADDGDGGGGGGGFGRSPRLRIRGGPGLFRSFGGGRRLGGGGCSSCQ